jgi:hypothetical protein
MEAVGAGGSKLRVRVDAHDTKKQRRRDASPARTIASKRVSRREFCLRKRVSVERPAARCASAPDARRLPRGPLTGSSASDFQEGVSVER